MIFWEIDIKNDRGCYKWSFFKTKFEFCYKLGHNPRGFVHNLPVSQNIDFQSRPYFFTPFTGGCIKTRSEFRQKSDTLRIELQRTPDFEWMSINRWQSIKTSSIFVLLATDEQSTHEKWKFDLKRDGGRDIYVSIYHCQIMIEFM